MASSRPSRITPRSYGCSASVQRALPDSRGRWWRPRSCLAGRISTLASCGTTPSRCAMCAPFWIRSRMWPREVNDFASSKVGCKNLDISEPKDSLKNFICRCIILDKNARWIKTDEVSTAAGQQLFEGGASRWRPDVLGREMQVSTTAGRQLGSYRREGSFWHAKLIRAATRSLGLLGLTKTTN